MLRMGSTDPSAELAGGQQREGALERELRAITSMSSTEEEDEGEGGGAASARAGGEAVAEVRLQLGGSRLDDLARIDALPGELPRNGFDSLDKAGSRGE